MFTEEMVIQRINDLQDAWDLNDYNLSKLAGLSNSSLSALRRRRGYPKLRTIEKICIALGITLREFFADEVIPERWKPYTPDERFLLACLHKMTEKQRKEFGACCEELVKLSEEQ